MSTFVSRVPLPNFSISVKAESIVIYDREQRAFGIPSLTLWPGGWDKSTMRRHLPGWCFLGITPNLLMCALRIEALRL